MVMWSGRDSLLNNIWTYRKTTQTDVKGNLRGTTVIIVLCETCLLLVKDAMRKYFLLLKASLRETLSWNIFNSNSNWTQTTLTEPQNYSPLTMANYQKYRPSSIYNPVCMLSASPMLIPHHQFCLIKVAVHIAHPVPSHLFVPIFSLRIGWDRLALNHSLYQIKLQVISGLICCMLNKFILLNNQQQKNKSQSWFQTALLGMKGEVWHTWILHGKSQASKMRQKSLQCDKSQFDVAKMQQDTIPKWTND